MLQRALATLLCLLGTAAVGLGVASATLWRPADTLTASLRSDDGIVLTDPGVLDLAADSVTISARAAAGPVVLALGRSEDVVAWVGADPATRVSGLASRTLLQGAAASAAPSTAPLTSASSEPSSVPTDGETSPGPSESATAAATDSGAPTAPPDPTGSDLWLQEASGTPTATISWTSVPGRWSVLAVADAGGPVTVQLTWPQVVTTPWRTPGLVVGSLLLAAGLAWWVVLAVRRYRPHAVLGLVTTAARWQATVRGRRGTGPAGAGVSGAPLGESTHVLAGRTGPIDAVDSSLLPEGAEAPTGGRRARRAREAAVADAEAASAAEGSTERRDGGPAAAARQTAPAVPPVGASPVPATPPTAERPADIVSRTAAEPTPAGGSAQVPLTRRALREQRERAEQERSGRSPRESAPVGDHDVAGAPDRDGDLSHAPSDHAGPSRDDSGSGPVVAPVLAQGATAGQVPVAPDAGPWSKVPAEGTTPDAPAPRGRLPFRRRRPPAAEPESESGPPAERAPEPEQTTDPTPPAPTASADAWRRAWGLPAGGTTWTPITGPDAQAEPPTPTMPTEEER